MIRIADSKGVVKSDLWIAHQLVTGGTPLVLARSMSNGKVNPVDKGWQEKPPSPHKLDEWFSGRGDVIGAVMGWTYDVFDFDPQNGCTLAEFLEYYSSLGHESLTVQGIVATPSGGHHLWVNTLNQRKRNPITRGVDYQGQLTWVAIPPSRKPSKVTGKIGAYRWVDYSPSGNDDGLLIRSALESWPNHKPLPIGRKTKARQSSDKITKKDVRRFLEEGLPEGAEHDNTLKQVTFLLCLWEYTEDEARTIWWDIVNRTDETGRPFEDKDFDRNWQGAERKLHDRRNRFHVIYRNESGARITRSIA